MKLFYLLSVFYLIVSFLLYPKCDRKINIIHSFIYTISLLFCYNTFIVCAFNFLKIDGSLLSYSLCNCLLGSIFNFYSLKTRNIQRYVLYKRELIIVLVIIASVFLIGFIRFRGFTTLSYESGDSAIHYRSSIYFSRELDMLNVDNSKDIIHNSFERFMPIFYVNCGILMNIFSSVITYWVFILFDVFCLILSALLFFVTILNVLNKKKYFYCLILTLLYTLGFPLNNLIFGFCYLGLGVLVINLLFLTVFKIIDFNERFILKMIILFIICFSVFFSYYLFVPCIYLALAIYWFYLWKKKKLVLKKLILYELLCLFIPFIIGVSYFVLPSFLEPKSVNVISAAGIDGYIYGNGSSICFFIFISLVGIIKYFRDKEKLNYYWIIFGIISGYVLLFSFLFIIEIVSLYYFYKLFYLYWLFSIIFIGILLLNRRKYLYVIFVFVISAMVMVCVFPSNMVSSLLVRSNIFSWNAKRFSSDKIIFNKDELEILNESIKDESICEVEKDFLISGSRLKNTWFYSYTGNIPLYGYQYGNPSQLGTNTIAFKFWKELDTHKCLIYFYEDKKIDFDEEEFDILYYNDSGAIIIKKDKI